MEINKQTLIVIKDAIREALINEDLDLLRGIQMLENTIWTHAAVGKSVIKYLWTKKEQGVDHVSRRELAKAYKHISKYMLFEKFLEENEFITVDYENNSVSLSKHWDWLFDRPDRNELVNPERLGKMITLSYRESGVSAEKPIFEIVEAAYLDETGKIKIQNIIDIFKEFKLPRRKLEEWIGRSRRKRLSPIKNINKNELQINEEAWLAVRRIRELERERSR